MSLDDAGLPAGRYRDLLAVTKLAASAGVAGGRRIPGEESMSVHA